MAVPKNTQTRFVGITYHTLYTSLRLLFLIINIIYTLLIQYVKYCYPWVYGIDFHSIPACAPYNIIIILCLCTATQKASVGMYRGCDTLSLQILFVYFLALPSLLHPSIFIQLFFILVTVLFLEPSG